MNLFVARLALLTLILGPTAASAQGFVNVTASAGLNVPGWASLGIIGRGSAWADFDLDGDQDVFVTGGPGRPIQWIPNLGNGTFGSPVVVHPASPTRDDHGCIAADFDNDGDQDVYVCVGNQAPNLFFVNDGSGTFVDAAASSGIAGAEDSFAAAAGDYDRDGHLDLYIGNHSLPSGLPQTDRLYRNNGDGSFTDVSATAGVAVGHAFAAYFCDVDHDGWPDIWVGHDKGLAGRPPNAVLRNLGNGVFADVAPTLNANAPIDCMGLTQGDLHNDGDWDVFCTNLVLIGHVLHVWDSATQAYLLPNGNFAATSLAWGIITTDSGWACGFFDYDLDGWLDLYVVHTSGSPAPNRLYKGSGAAPFIDVSSTSGFAAAGPAATSATHVDYDDDGDLDIWMPGDLLPGQLIRNDGASGKWIRFKLTGTTSNRDAIGAVVRVRCGNTWRQRMVTCGEGFLSSADRRVHFGLGSNNLVDEVEIRWPSGSIEYRSNLAVDQDHAITEARVTVTPAPAPGVTSIGTAICVDDVGRTALHLLSLWPFLHTSLPDGRILRLSGVDPLVIASTQPLNGFFGPVVSSVDTSGASSTTLVLPNIPWLSGVQFNWTVLTIDPQLPSLVRSVVGPTPLTIL